MRACRVWKGSAMKSPPIRIRLTFWYFAMFASAAALLCVASLWMLQRSVDETECHDLQERADDVRAVLSHEDPSRSIEQLETDFAGLYALKDDGKYLQVRDERGNWIFRSKRMIAENPALPAPAELPKGGLITQFRQSNHLVRTLTRPINAQGKLYAVQTGIALDKSMSLIDSFRTKLLLLTPIMILLAAAGGHAMSRKALRPVAILAANARRINDRNLDIRLPVSSAKDEVSDLSLTLNQMLERIDKAFASVRAFTGNASHELRTPIALLRTEIEVALNRPRKVEEYRATLGRLHEETVRMTILVENLLSLARADGGAEAIALAPIRANALLRQMAETWKSEMDRALLDFHVEMPGGDLAALGDEAGIRRLLSILLENARKFTPPGGMVRLGAAAQGAYIVFSVRDTGFGIALEHQSRIFERFYRAAPDGASLPGGSGLGLALAKWIAERHNTDLKVESEPGRGSCFFFSLEGTGAIAAGNNQSINRRSESVEDSKRSSMRSL
jgi:heavy metal sensor kinase